MTHKINIILDLDNTLISAVSEDEERKIKPILTNRMQDFQWKDMDGAYKIFARPHLQEFLTFLFSKFNVSVWTAASKSYALFIIDEFVIAGKSNRTLDYILFSHHCRESKRHNLCQKSLEMLESTFPMKYNLADTFIIDDHHEVYSSQPTNCIKIKPFEISKESAKTDRELLKIMKRLEKICSVINC
jgi:TFIIF-interacting CTD phosphatase-like protein